MFPGLDIVMRQQAELLLAADGPNIVNAKLHWRTVTRPDGWNPNDESSGEGCVVTPQELPFRTFFHQVDHRASGFQRFMEIQTGDVILDYLADLALDGKEDARVEIGGKFYVQKSASTGLLETWDVMQGNGGMFKSLLLAPAP